MSSRNPLLLLLELLLLFLLLHLLLLLLLLDALFPLLFQLLFVLLLQLLQLLVLVEFIDFLEGTISNLWTGYERFDGNGIGGGQYVFIEPRKIIVINRSGFVDPFF